MRYNRHGAYENGRSIKNSRFLASLFAIYLIVLLLMTGIHTGLILSVADTGCGMDQTSLQHIFDKFYQGDTSHSKEGNGLGLALAKRVLELSDGDIHVTSTPGTGCIFTVTLPAAKSQKDQGERA